MITRLPASARRQAATAPPKPLPMTIASQSMVRLAWVAQVRAVAVPQLAQEHPSEPREHAGTLSYAGAARHHHRPEQADQRADIEPDHPGAHHRTSDIRPGMEAGEQRRRVLPEVEPRVVAH